jgi:hypothetical protein
LLLLLLMRTPLLFAVLLTTHGMLFGTGFSACDFWKIADS